MRLVTEPHFLDYFLRMQQIIERIPTRHQVSTFFQWMLNGCWMGAQWLLHPLSPLCSAYIVSTKFAILETLPKSVAKIILFFQLSKFFDTNVTFSCIYQFFVVTSDAALARSSLPSSLTNSPENTFASCGIYARYAFFCRPLRFTQLFDY